MSSTPANRRPVRRRLVLRIALVAAVVLVAVCGISPTTFERAAGIRAASAAAVAPSPAPVAPTDETWEADESARGTRPDAIH